MSEATVEAPLYDLIYVAGADAAFVWCTHPDCDAPALLPQDALDYYATKGFEPVPAVDPAEGLTPADKAVALAGTENTAVTSGLAAATAGSPTPTGGATPDAKTTSSAGGPSAPSQTGSYVPTSGSTSS